jgi:hypothetical protein
MNEAEDRIKKAIEADKKNGTMWSLSRDYALYAVLFKHKGDQSKARENLEKSVKILQECRADGWVKKYEKDWLNFNNKYSFNCLCHILWFNR